MGLYDRWRDGWDADRVAIRAPDGEHTYGSLHQAVRRATGLLHARGVRPGHVVAIGLPKSLAFLELHLAALRLGAVTLPFNDRYTLPEVRHLLSDAHARLAVVPDPIALGIAGELPTLPASGTRAAIEGSRPEDEPTSPPDVAQAALLYTSGTTGRPKGVPLTHANLAATVEALHTAWRWSSEDVLLHALPLSHVHGLVVAQHAALRAGATSVWVDRFDAADVLGRLAAGEASIFMGVPTLYGRMLQVREPFDLSRVRLFTSGSAALPEAVHRAFAERFGRPIVERYGMTEVGIVVSNVPGRERPGAIGLPLPGVRVRIVDPAHLEDLPPGEVGELWVSAPSVFAGYLGRPDATAEAKVGEWMRTGDLGFADADGILRLVGRRSELLVTGGFNVYPAEVEAALLEHPRVREAAVFGLPDDDLGEVPAAVVAGDVDAQALRDFARERLAPYKVPRRIELVAELPRNAMGKVLKADLVRRYTFAGDDA